MFEWFIIYAGSAVLTEPDLECWISKVRSPDKLQRHLTAVFPGQALTCFEAGLPALFILSPWNLPLSWVLISLTHSSVLPLGPCWFDFRISPFSSYSVTGVQKVVSTEVTLHVLVGKLMEFFWLGSVCFQREPGWVHYVYVIYFRSSR